MTSVPALLGQVSTLETPGRRALALTWSMVSDTSALTISAKSFLVYNGYTADVFISLLADADTQPVVWPFPMGVYQWYPLTVAKVLVTGSSANLQAAIAGGFYFNMLLE